MYISIYSKQQLLDITERTLKLVLFAFVCIDFCLVSVGNLYSTGIQQSQTQITLNGLSSKNFFHEFLREGKVHLLRTPERSAGVAGKLR